MKPTNFRIDAAGEFLRKLHISSVLDVGSRGCEALSVVPSGVEYCANDLFQNSAGSIDYVGDILAVNFDRTFSCVMALDIIEHVDDPYCLMDKLAVLADKYLLLSLPNIYDVSHKYDFIFRSTLGEKYKFRTENSLDRHRWIMNYDEIHEFFQSYSKKYSMNLETKDILIGENARNPIIRTFSKTLLRILGRKNMTRTVIGLFIK